MEQYMWIVWLVAFVLFIIIEAIGTDLVTIWFAGGALIALIISFIPNVPWWVQLIVFFVISIVCLFAVRPLARKYMRGKIVKSNVESLVGRKGMICISLRTRSDWKRLILFLMLSGRKAA